MNGTVKWYFDVRYEKIFRQWENIQNICFMVGNFFVAYLILLNAGIEHLRGINWWNFRVSYWSRFANKHRIGASRIWEFLTATPHTLEANAWVKLRVTTMHQPLGHMITTVNNDSAQNDYIILEKTLIILETGLFLFLPLDVCGMGLAFCCRVLKLLTYRW